MDESHMERDDRTVARPVHDDPADVVRRWLAWFGWGRIVAVGVSAVLVVGGAWLLLRAPAPPVEQGLPMASPAPTAASVSSPSAVAAPSSIGGAFVVVHVAGAVRSPGVYTLHGDARLHDAVDTAGGALEEADLDRLNLAEPLVDGHRIYVPEVGVEPPVSLTSDTAVASGPVDLNRADVSVLQSLPGVGPATAAAIADDRLRNGPFASVDELDRVPGIGPSKLAALRDLVTV